ncbi:hypothetical protein B0O99DRAFT_630252 [Bisporella sp. PMI_857]|nr:hypothetical protein B0O99DRAFT_630252 [Bisporella sp. PMI_857]
MPIFAKSPSATDIIFHLQATNDRLSKIDSQVAAISALDNFEKRVTALSTLNTRIGSLETTIQAAREQTLLDRLGKLTRTACWVVGGVTVCTLVYGLAKYTMVLEDEVERLKRREERREKRASKKEGRKGKKREHREEEGWERLSGVMEKAADIAVRVESRQNPGGYFEDREQTPKVEEVPELVKIEHSHEGCEMEGFIGGELENSEYEIDSHVSRTRTDEEQVAS